IATTRQISNRRPSFLAGIKTINIRAIFLIKPKLSIRRGENPAKGRHGRYVRDEPGRKRATIPTQQPVAIAGEVEITVLILGRAERGINGQIAGLLAVFCPVSLRLAKLPDATTAREPVVALLILQHSIHPIRGSIRLRFKFLVNKMRGAGVGSSPQLIILIE